MTVLSADQLAGSDAALLRRFMEQRDESAFSELAQRHVRLVYSAALRRVGDRHLAEDVCQAVFFILSKKARSAARVNPLSAWLLKTVKYTAANAMKIEARRQRRERQASQNAHSAGWASADPSAILLWQELAAHLDDALLGLSSADRAAVLMRYFENRPIADIATQLAASEGSIKQRLHRSLEKLRTQLQRRGAVLEGIATDRLAYLIESHAITHSPPGLAGKCASAAHGLTTAKTILISKGALRMMRITKTKLAIVIASVVLAGGAGEFLQPRHARPNQAMADSDPVNLQVDPVVQAKVEAAAPVVISTEPRAGLADIDPSVNEIRITYSKDMADHSWSWCQTSDDTFPKSAGQVHYEADHRTCVMPVKLEPGKVYKIYLNRGQFLSFQDSNGTPAVPYALVFGTKK